MIGPGWFDRSAALRRLAEDHFDVLVVGAGITGAGCALDAASRGLRTGLIERDDFAEVPPPKFFRLSPGREVRLRGAYFVTATDVVKDEQGNVVEVLATYDPASKGGNSPDGRKVKSTMHWVSAQHAVAAAVALYGRLFTAEAPGDATGEALDDLNPDSRDVLAGAKVEAALLDAQPGPLRDNVQRRHQQDSSLGRLGHEVVQVNPEVGDPVLAALIAHKSLGQRGHHKGSAELDLRNRALEVHGVDQRVDRKQDEVVNGLHEREKPSSSPHFQSLNIGHLLAIAPDGADAARAARAAHQSSLSRSSMIAHSIHSSSGLSTRPSGLS